MRHAIAAPTTKMHPATPHTNHHHRATNPHLRAPRALLLNCSEVPARRRGRHAALDRETPVTEHVGFGMPLRTSEAPWRHNRPGASKTPQRQATAWPQPQQHPKKAGQKKKEPGQKLFAGDLLCGSQKVTSMIAACCCCQAGFDHMDLQS